MKNLELTIKEIADLFKVSTRTIRFYEEKGLLQSKRKDNNYRVYDISSINRLEMIVSLKRSGLSLDQIQELIQHPSDAKKTLYAQKEALSQQMVMLYQSQRYIDQLLERVLLVEKYGLQKVFIERKKVWDHCFLEEWKKPKNGIYIDEDETIEIGINPSSRKIIGVYQKTSNQTLKSIATYYFYQNEVPIFEYVAEFVDELSQQGYSCDGLIFLNSNDSLCWLSCEVIFL